MAIGRYTSGFAGGFHSDQMVRIDPTVRLVAVVTCDPSIANMSLMAFIRCSAAFNSKATAGISVIIHIVVMADIAEIVRTTTVRISE